MAALPRLQILAAAPLLLAIASGCAGRTAAAAAAPAASAPTATPPSASSAAATATPVPPASPTPTAKPARAALSTSTAFGQIHAGLEDASSDDCLACHADAEPRVDVHRSHKLGLDLAAAPPGGFRPLAEIAAAGLALPDGKVACVTCHDLASPWEHRIALPAGAVPRRAVVLGDPSTYGDDGSGEPPPPEPGQAISTKPLCQACHAF